MKSKTSELRDAVARGDSVMAITIASKFFDRSEDTRIFKRAKSAMENPGFYRQIGKDPQQIIDAAWSKINERFSIVS